MLTEIVPIAGKDERFLPNSTIIISEWAGLFGNHLFQLTNAIFICLKYDCQLDIPEHEFLKVKSFNAQKGGNTKKSYFVSRFFDALDCRGVYPNLAERQFILKNYVRYLLTFDVDQDPVGANEHRLTLQIRSGDTFVKVPHPKYVPPPFSYYTKIMDQYQEQEMLIVCENKNNPVIEALYNRYSNCEIQSSDIVTDIQTIANASNLVFSCGTFGLTFALMSHRIERFYVNDIPRGILDFGFYEPDNWALGFDLIRYHIANYISFGEWKNTPEQVDLLLNLDQRNIHLLSEKEHKN